jgi:hypothetical protein
MAKSSAYYIWDTGETTAFPNGFRMIGGFDVDKSYANAECVNETPCDDGDDCYTNTHNQIGRSSQLQHHVFFVKNTNVIL